MFSALVIGLVTPAIEASHRMVNGFLKSGVTSTGAVVMLVFKSSNGLIASADNSNFFMRSFFKQSLSGAAVWA